MAKNKKESITSHVSADIGERDDLLTSLADELNKKNKDGGKIAFFLDEQDDPSTITDWVSTGSTLLDLAISNRKNGGLPVGRFVELNGLESTGKSLICAHICAETQKKGGRAIVIDTESSAAPEFWASFGVDLSKLLYIHRETVEEIFDVMEQSIAYIRKTNKDTLLTIIVDSVAGATTKKEMETDHGVDGYNTAKAIIISKAMRKITSMLARQRVLVVFTNQLREKLNAMAFGDKYTTPGGKALAYHCSVRVRLANTGKLKKDDKVVGNTCSATIIKNRMGPPHRKAEFNIYYDSGVADYDSWVKVLKDEGIVTQKGPRFEYEGNSYSTSDFVSKLNSDPDFKESVYDKICQASIMVYKKPNSEIKDVELDASDADTNEPDLE